jgi:tetratricopeptide (TPR) repeat protein
VRSLLIGIGLLSLLIGGVAQADRASTHYHKAMALKRQGNIDQAIAALRQAIAERDDYAAAHRSIGVLYRQSKQYGKAVMHLERAASLQPQAADVHYSLGLAYYRNGDKEKALRAIKRASSLKPNDARMRAQLGTLMVRSDPEGAIVHLKEAVRLDPQNAGHLHQLGLAYRRASARVGKNESKRREYLKQAQKTLEQAVALGETAELNFDLGVLYRRLDKPFKSIEHYRRALDMKPKMAAAWWDLGHMYAKSKQHEEAIAAYEQYLKLQGHSKDAPIAQKRIKELKKRKK